MMMEKKEPVWGSLVDSVVVAKWVGDSRNIGAAHL
jgi:hypothetical protein